GQKWPEVLEQYRKQYWHSTKEGGKSTYIGDLGHFVVFKHHLLGKSYFIESDNCLVPQGPTPPTDFANLANLPRSHGKIILKATEGQFLKLEDRKELYLYHITEVYE